jgi:chromosome segregation ATPase
VNIDKAIAIIPDAKPGMIKVVRDDSYSIASESNNGWTLVAILQQVQAESVQVQKTNAQGYQSYDTEAVQVTETLYVLRQDPDATLDDMNKRMVEANSKADKLDRENAELRKQTNEAVKEQERLKQTSESIQRQYERILDQLDGCRETRGKLEKDVGTYRAKLQRLEKALGKLRMDEILAEEDSQS